MANTEMEGALRLLFLDGNSKEVRTAIETLLKIFRNVAQNPEDERYKCLKLSNSTFFKNVWRYDGARQFLLKAGWKARESEIIFEDPTKLDTALKILLTRRTVSPEHDEWTGDVMQGPSKQQLREKELREKAVVERNKELAEFFKNKEERRRIAECVKAEHIADRKRLELLKPNVPNLEAKINVPAQGT